MKTQRAPLSVMNAEINTAAVKINTLQISGKQVTLAVFRQLPEEYPLDKCAWKGIPWGWVNYLCERGERNVVWQQGEELKRGVMRVPPPNPNSVPPSGRAWYWADVHERRREHKGSRYEWKPFVHSDTGQRFSVWPAEELWPAEGQTSASLLLQVEQELATEQRLFAADWERWKELAVLPQLFIAV